MENKERKGMRGYLYAWPSGLWYSLFFAVPLVIILVYSFLEKGLYGGVVWSFSLSAYRQIFKSSFLSILARTVMISTLSTLVCMMLALPASYAMARSRNQSLLLFLIMVPFWTNSLIRIYAWITLLSTEGFINSALMAIGIINTPLDLIYNNTAVVIVLVYMYLPFAILPLFSTIDKFDFTLLDAARDLGCSKLEGIMKVLIPNIRSGIATSLVFTFIPIFGAYTVPLLVGGMESSMVGNIVVDQVQKTRNWPLASAFSVILTLLSMIAILWMLSKGRKSEGNKEAGR